MHDKQGQQRPREFKLGTVYSVLFYLTCRCVAEELMQGRDLPPEEQQALRAMGMTRDDMDAFASYLTGWDMTAEDTFTFIKCAPMLESLLRYSMADHANSGAWKALEMEYMPLAQNLPPDLNDDLRPTAWVAWLQKEIARCGETVRIFPFSPQTQVCFAQWLKRPYVVVPMVAPDATDFQGCFKAAKHLLATRFLETRDIGVCYHFDNYEIVVRRGTDYEELRRAYVSARQVEKLKAFGFTG